MQHIRLLVDHFNIIFSSAPLSCEWSLSLRSPHQNPVYTSPPYMLHVPPISFFLFDHPNDIWWKVQTIKLLVCSLLCPLDTLSLLSPNIFLSTLFSISLSLRSYLSVRVQVSHSYKTTGKIIFLYILVFICLDRKLEGKKKKVSAPNDSQHSWTALCSWLLSEDKLIMKFLVFRFENFVESFVFKNADGTDAQRRNFIICF
jgi:hypothetical protein